MPGNEGFHQRWVEDIDDLYPACGLGLLATMKGGVPQSAHGEYFRLFFCLNRLGFDVRKIMVAK
jgi:hypothetical protein